jgi:hypothetical protein
MSKRKINISIANYGRYTTWNKKSKKLPKLLHYTDTIEAIDGNEFGIIINVDNAKGQVLEFIIKHPPLLNPKGNLLPQFKGELYVNTIHTQFFVGDGIWLPLEDKIGEWKIIILLDNKEIVSKKFMIIPAKNNII